MVHDSNVDIGPVITKPPYSLCGIPIITPDLFGIPIITSDLFPYNIECLTCGGSGEGTESTYCHHCHGAGDRHIIGSCSEASGRMTLFTEPLPRKFAPYFPRDVAIPPRPLSRGLA